MPNPRDLVLEFQCPSRNYSLPTTLQYLEMKDFEKNADELQIPRSPG